MKNLKHMKIINITLEINWNNSYVYVEALKSTLKFKQTKANI